MKPKALNLDVDPIWPDVAEESERIEALRLTIREYLPEFASMVHDADSQEILIRQDSFAPAYADDEYMLLGMAIKYAGLYGVTISIVGENGETF